VNVELTEEEVSLIHDCIAAELARVIMHVDPGNEQATRLIDLGKRFGMEL